MVSIAGFVSSPQVKADFDEFSRHFYYYHTDCIWVATAKPAEQWSASISTTNKGVSVDFIHSGILKSFENIFESIHLKLVRPEMGNKWELPALRRFLIDSFKMP